jgi:hypothetical protein
MQGPKNGNKGPERNADRRFLPGRMQTKGISADEGLGMFAAQVILKKSLSFSFVPNFFLPDHCV